MLPSSIIVPLLYKQAFALDIVTYPRPPLLCLIFSIYLFCEDNAINKNGVKQRPNNKKAKKSNGEERAAVAVVLSQLSLKADDNDGHRLHGFDSPVKNHVVFRMYSLFVEMALHGPPGRGAEEIISKDARSKLPQL